MLWKNGEAEVNAEEKIKNIKKIIKKDIKNKIKILTFLREMVVCKSYLVELIRGLLRERKQCAMIMSLL